MQKQSKFDVYKLTYLAIMTAVVVVLQLAGAFIRFGTFSVSLVLLPIVLGTVVGGIGGGVWLGAVFGVTVLISGDAALFLGIDAFGTVLTVMAKGMLCGFAAGLVYKSLARVNTYLAVIAAAVACPIVNTGVFLIGCRLFFYDWICDVAAVGSGWGPVAYMFIGLVGLNFVFELLFNVVLSPILVRLIRLLPKAGKEA